MKYYINKNGKIIGPGTATEIRSLLATHYLEATDLVRQEKDPVWRPVGSLPDFIAPEHLIPRDSSPRPFPKPSLPEATWPAVKSPSAETASWNQANSNSPDRSMTSVSDEAGTVPATEEPELDQAHPRMAPVRLRRAGRWTPTAIAGWALVLAAIWTFGYFVAVQLLEKEPAVGPVTIQPASGRRPTTAANRAQTFRPTTIARHYDDRLFRPGFQPFPTNTPRQFTPIVPPAAVEMSRVAPAEMVVYQREGAGSMDLRNSPFQSYDADFIRTIRARWIEILSEHDFVRGQTGRVTVEFNLSPNGRVSEVKTVRNEMDDLLAWLCQKAVLEGGPYAGWPTKMRLLVPAGYRLIRFTFHYE